MPMPFGTKMKLVKRKEAMEQARITIRCSWPGCVSSVSVYRSQGVWGGARKHVNGEHSVNAYCQPCKERVSLIAGKPLGMNGFGRVFAKLNEKRASRICNSESFRVFLFIRGDGSCSLCKSDLKFSEYPKSWQVDHVVPVAMGGKLAFKSPSSLH